MDVVGRRRIQQRVHRPMGHANLPEVTSYREAIIGMRVAGMAQATIAWALGLSVLTVSKWIQRSEEAGIITTRLSGGRPQKITAEDDQRIVQQ